MLHDLRKLHASVGKSEEIPDATLRRILNHTPPKTDTLNRHYVVVEIEEVGQALVVIQEKLNTLMTQTTRCRRPIAGAAHP